jgi:uncharacterized membrane protein
MRRSRPWLLVVLLGAVVGVVFAGVSTYDFVQHLDRQVHNLHCSFIPGVSHSGESGCQLAMMSPYSSVLRGRVWGGVPIALPALSVFAFLVFYALDLALTRRKTDPRDRVPRAGDRAAGAGVAGDAADLGDPARHDLQAVRVHLRRQRAVPGRRAGAVAPGGARGR